MFITCRFLPKHHTTKHSIIYLVQVKWPALAKLRVFALVSL